MAELIIRLEIDSVTGKKNVVIDYGSDEDALPMEHEEDHRRLVDALVHGGTLSAAELGTIVIRRGDTARVLEVPDPEALAERVSVGTTDE